MGLQPMWLNSSETGFASESNTEKNTSNMEIKIALTLRNMGNDLEVKPTSKSNGSSGMSIELRRYISEKTNNMKAPKRSLWSKKYIIFLITPIHQEALIDLLPA